jgi:hypothetical protein
MMKMKIQQRKRNAFLFARALCTWFLLLLLPAGAATQLPFSVPLRFGSDKVIEFPVEVERNRNYQIDLVFVFNDQEQRVAARKLAGEPARICKALNECGVTPSFRITIRRGANVLLREEATPVGTYAFSSNGFYRAILKSPLKPDHYNIIVEVTSSPAELTNYGALIQFTTDPRSSDLEN